MFVPYLLSPRCVSKNTVFTHKYTSMRGHAEQVTDRSKSLLKVNGHMRRIVCFPYGPRCKKTCLREFANNKGADQPAHTRSLISAFVIHLLESTIC